MRTNHKLLDLFSGIGGFSLGAEQNGIETIGFVEKDEFCQKVLKKHWSDVPIIDDIRKVNGKDFGSATIISGGFPCQPFSVAGKREGTDDDRYLWDEMLRVISSCKPTWVIGENVEGLINIQDGMVLRSVQDDLEREGFQVQCLVIPASGIGAWHQRNRVWIVAHSEHNGSYRQKGDATIKSSNQQKDRLSIRDDKNVSDSIKNGLEIPIIQSNNIQTSKAKKNVYRSFEKQQTWWQAQSELRGVPNGVSYELHSNRTDRIKALGNSIVPQIAEQIFRSIIDAE